MLTGISINGIELKLPKEKGVTIINKTEIVNSLYHSMMVLLGKPTNTTISSEIELKTINYTLVVVIKDGLIEKEFICSREDGRVISKIELGNWQIIFEDEILVANWFNFDDVIEVDVPDKPWKGSIFLEKGLILPIDLFHESDDVNYDELTIDTPSIKIKNALVNLDFIRGPYDTDIVKNYEMLSSGTKYAIYLFDKVLKCKGTLIVCDPWIKKFHPLIEGKFLESLNRNTTLQYLTFGISLYRNEENIPVLT